MTVSKETLGEALIGIGQRVKDGKCAISEEQMEKLYCEIQDSLDIPLSRESAQKYLRVSRSQFTNMMAQGKIPRGRKRLGFKELSWSRRQLHEACKNSRP